MIQTTKLSIHRLNHADVAFADVDIEKLFTCAHTQRQLSLRKERAEQINRFTGSMNDNFEAAITANNLGKSSHAL